MKVRYIILHKSSARKMRHVGNVHRKIFLQSLQYFVKRDDHSQLFDAFQNTVMQSGCHCTVPQNGII